MDKELLKQKKIGVLMGGLSREREISLKTGKAIANALSGKGYRVQPIDVGRDIAAVLAREKIEYAFVALHGRWGEDGTIQGMLELMEIPYTGSGVLASALAMHKIMSKKLFACEKIPTPSFEVVQRRETINGMLNRISLPLPLVIKPAREGSTIGISIVREETQLLPALREAGKYDDEILVETFIKGKEITVAVLDGLVLPVIEIAPKSGFYDYHSKYTKGETEYILPARIPREKYLYSQEIALKSYQAFGCCGCVRVDLMNDENGNPYVIDVNTMPGMTETSLAPQAAAFAGIPFEDLAERILLGAALKL
jgi:D-alanine-D-alanine ligase